jgi:hypothetical protein
MTPSWHVSNNNGNADGQQLKYSTSDWVQTRAAVGIIHIPATPTLK